MGFSTLIPGELTELSLSRDEKGRPVSVSCAVRLSGLCHELEYHSLSVQRHRDGSCTTRAAALDTDIWLECWFPGKDVQGDGGMEMPELCAARGAENVSISLHVLVNKGIMRQMSASGPCSYPPDAD